MEKAKFGEEPKTATPSAAKAPAPAPAHAEPPLLAQHTVEPGETLSHLSLKYYGSAVKEKWMVIYEANREVIGDNPNVVRPGTLLKIPKLAE